MSLKNLFKYKLPIQFSYYIGNTPVGGVVGENGCDFGYHFESDRIHDAKKLSISKPLDIYEKLKPFLKYLISKIRYEVQFPYRIIVDVSLYSEQQSYRMIHFVLDENFTHDGVLILQYFSNIFKQSFCLRIYAHCYCPPGLRVREDIFSDNEDDGDESEDEDKDGAININKIKTYKMDECVICLENKNNVLFCNCGHICVCKKCIEIKRLTKCPVCKTKNTILRIIE